MNQYTQKLTNLAKEMKTEAAMRGDVVKRGAGLAAKACVRSTNPAGRRENCSDGDGARQPQHRRATPLFLRV